MHYIAARLGRPRGDGRGEEGKKGRGIFFSSRSYRYDPPKKWEVVETRLSLGEDPFASISTEYWSGLIHVHDLIGAKSAIGSSGSSGSVP